MARCFSFDVGGVEVSIRSSCSAADGEPTGVKIGDFSNSLPCSCLTPSNFSRTGLAIVGLCVAGGRVHHINLVRRAQAGKIVIPGHNRARARDDT